MKRKDTETLWLYFSMAYDAASKGNYEDAQAHAQIATDMITLCCARKKQSQMAISAIAYRDQRKTS
jgi:hypothetical protein